MTLHRRPRAVYRDYPARGARRSARVTRLHIVREEGPRGWRPGSQTLCGQGAWDVTNSATIILDPMPAQPPDGLTWCPACVGHLAEVLGLLGDIAASLAACDPCLAAP